MRKTLVGLVLIASTFINVSCTKKDSDQELVRGYNEFSGEFVVYKMNTSHSSEIKQSELVAKCAIPESDLKSLEECVSTNNSPENYSPPLVSLWFLDENKLNMFTAAPLNDDFVLGVHHFDLRYNHAFCYNHKTKKISRAYLVANLKSEDIALFKTDQNFELTKIGQEIPLGKLESYNLIHNFDVRKQIHEHLDMMVKKNLNESKLILRDKLYDEINGDLAYVQRDRRDDVVAIFMENKMRTGSSGAPLYSKSGELLGVFSSYEPNEPRIAYFTSDQIVYNFIKDLVIQMRQYNSKLK